MRDCGLTRTITARAPALTHGSIVDRDSWSALNLRAGVLNENWDVTLFADNVTDERANLADNRSIAAEMPGRPRIVTNRPRTIGLGSALSLLK